MSLDEALVVIASAISRYMEMVRSVNKSVSQIKMPDDVLFTYDNLCCKLGEHRVRDVEGRDHVYKLEICLDADRKSLVLKPERGETKIAVVPLNPHELVRDVYVLIHLHLNSDLWLQAIDKLLSKIKELHDAVKSSADVVKKLIASFKLTS